VRYLRHVFDQPFALESPTVAGNSSGTARSAQVESSKSSGASRILPDSLGLGDSLRPKRRLSFFEIYEQVEEMPIEIAPITSRHRVYFTRVAQRFISPGFGGSIRHTPDRSGLRLNARGAFAVRSTMPSFLVVCRASGSLAIGHQPALRRPL
jgi:hypothetical protein